MDFGIVLLKVVRGLMAFLVFSLLIVSSLTAYAGGRHSPELRGRSAEIQEAPEVLTSWLNSIGREDLSVLLGKVLAEDNRTLVSSVLRTVQDLMFSGSPASLFVGAKHLIALRLLNGSEDLSIGVKDLSQLLFYTTLYLNSTGYTTLSGVLLKVLSGLVSYGDHSDLSYFMLYLTRGETLPNVSEGLRSSLRLQILNFLDYVELGEFKKAVELGVNTSHTDSLVIGSYMYVVASIYLKHVPTVNPVTSSQSSDSGVVLRVLEIIERMNLTTTVSEILRRIPAEELWAVLNKLNILNNLEGVDEGMLVEEINKYLVERHFDDTLETGLLPRPWSTSTTVVSVEPLVEGRDSTFSYRLTNELKTLMNLVASKTSLEALRKSSIISGGTPSKSSMLIDSSATFYDTVFIVVISFTLTLGVVPLAIRFGRTRRIPVTSTASIEFPRDENMINSVAVMSFWRVVSKLTSRLEMHVGRHETHRELKTRIVEKAGRAMNEGFTELMDMLTQYYELVRFGNMCEDEVVKSEVRRIEESILKE
ncbi:MAG: hypothetical protein QXX81_03020 [Zestosphaera sp.]